MPQTSLVRILHKRLGLNAYKVQIVQDLQPNDGPRRSEFAIEILNRFGVENDCLNRICFSDESTFHASGMLEEFQPWIMFQQEGAPPYWGSLVRDFVDETFPDRWIGSDGPTTWPPRSPDITPLDFFVWGYIKGRVFATPFADVEELRARIQAAVCTATEDMLKNTWRELEYCVDILRATKGAHVEISLGKCSYKNYDGTYNVSKQTYV
ncbi:hypothetical protein AVEN_83923-1 [Araneus ventricosus]|uniref:Transposable element Tc3 transposase n=1 Tax=Araneus ventricosus TaxID=182803 RepID=A0A4Y2P6D5_ARAVE|nr:hypothetical protein AVEN_83923-1 [Araneus ventricosus]